MGFHKGVSFSVFLDLRTDLRILPEISPDFGGDHSDCFLCVKQSGPIYSVTGRLEAPIYSFNDLRYMAEISPDFGGDRSNCFRLR